MLWKQAVKTPFDLWINWPASTLIYPSTSLSASFRILRTRSSNLSRVTEVREREIEFIKKTVEVITCDGDDKMATEEMINFDLKTTHSFLYESYCCRLAYMGITLLRHVILKLKKFFQYVPQKKYRAFSGRLFSWPWLFLIYHRQYCETSFYLFKFILVMRIKLSGLHLCVNKLWHNGKINFQI